MSYRASAVFIAFCFALAAYVLYGTQADREAFVAHYQEKQCSISNMRSTTGKNESYKFEIDCPHDRTRFADVSRDRYVGSSIGQNVTIYSSIQNPSIWEFFRPTKSGHEERTQFQWLVWFGLAGATLIGFGVIWGDARREEAFLRGASFVDAEVLDMHTESYGKSTAIILRVKYQVVGEWIEAKVSSPGKVVSDSFRNRTVRLAVGKDDPRDCRISDRFNYSELIPDNEIH